GLALAYRALVDAVGLLELYNGRLVADHEDWNSGTRRGHGGRRHDSRARAARSNCGEEERNESDHCSPRWHRLHDLVHLPDGKSCTPTLTVANRNKSYKSCLTPFRYTCTAPRE